MSVDTSLEQLFFAFMKTKVPNNSKSKDIKDDNEYFIYKYKMAMIWRTDPGSGQIDYRRSPPIGNSNRIKTDKR